MKFSESFKSTLQDKLAANKGIFEEKSLQIVDEVFNTPARVILVSLCDYYYPFKIDYKRCVEIIKNSVKDPENLTIRKRLGSSYNFWENEIYFVPSQNEPPFWGTKEEEDYRFKTENFEYECEDEFWLDEVNHKDYEKLSGFNCFNRIAQDKDSIKIFGIKGAQYNKDAWKEYVVKLIEYHFSDFTLDLPKSNKMLRFLKPINSEFYFGFEYDTRELARFLPRNQLVMPEYMNIIIVHKSFTKKVKDAEYVNGYSDTIFSLGVLGNPFFYHPCFPIQGFAAVDMYHKKDVFMSMVPNYMWEHKELGDNMVEIIAPEMYGEKLKKHLFYYMKLLAYSSAGYLEYLEKSIVDALQAEA
ncbi:hypothetical protein [Flavobacterium subsaxonicum]|uniref:Uncharacterized protein n=1 Tax=Flavobacterium subsaxonicum WB 4.1-42 = DSM 21790 TaxID=1121898 RepID=A0A0A2MUE4_9FLAO|nr:hypothetical protein [Flavobacterium subsaxonicum]KGO91845.1 hypothetical protein Q766_15475 [Flavobacterium subsaxonicum WB 4.1-42 = DSM 21790]